MLYVDLFMYRANLPPCSQMWWTPHPALMLTTYEYYRVNSENQISHLFIVIRDYINPTNPKTVFPNFHLHADFAMMGANMLNCVNTNITGACSAEPCLHISYQTISVKLIPSCRLLVRLAKPVQKHMKTQTRIPSLLFKFALSAIIFREVATQGGSTKLEENLASVTCYISKFVDDATVSKTIATNPNQRLWMTGDLYMQLRT